MELFMLLTKEVDYALRVVRDLGKGDKRSAKDICANEKMPEAFTYKILKKLESGGIVKSIRGAQGGYMLTSGIEELYMEDIIKVIDPNMGVIQCSHNAFACDRKAEMGCCNTNKELRRIESIIMDEMRRYTLSEIFNDNRKN